MAVTPNQVSLTYKKNYAAPFVYVVVDYNVIVPTPAQNTEPWLKIIQHSVDSANKKATYKVTVDTAKAANLAEGIYTTRAFVTEATYDNAWFYGSHYFEVSLRVVNTQRLNISKQDYTFNYVIGGTAPATQPLTINSENNWSVIFDKTWASASTPNGSGNQTINLAVDVTGLSSGLYEANFIVDDGQDTRAGLLTLLVNGPTEDNDHLDLSHTALTFSEQVTVAPSSAANITIDSSLPVTITTTTPWLNLSTASLAAGKNTITISTQATEAIAVGSYIGNFKVQSGYATKVVNVLLRIVEVVINGVESNGFYFAKDRNVLFLTTTEENTEALLDFSTQTSNNIHVYTKRIPFFENAVETVIGLETATLLKPVPLPVLVSGIYTPLEPIKIDLKVFDKKLNSSALTERSSFTNLNFINGKTPLVADKLSSIPNNITTTKDGVVAFSFMTEDPLDSINITGDVTQAIAVTKPSGNIFTAIVELTPLALKAQDKITITCGPIVLNVVIKPSELETFQLIWENEWDCPEVINLDGSVEIIEEDDSKTVSLSEAGREISRIIDIKEPKSFRVNTGNIYTDEEAKWLSGVLRSRKMWLQINGERIEVIRTFRTISVFKTRGFQRNYRLTFDAAVR